MPTPAQPDLSPPSDTTLSAPSDFAQRVLRWFSRHGRHDLPWQYHQADVADIYAVWLSEIMLQQTQVQTVLAYYERFLAAFPTVQDLAAAEWDAVAALWAGLGYYARARNLHAGAKQVAAFIREHGHYPETLTDWMAIKGVGRSTAGAIMAMGVRRAGVKGVICDGNVKRVLTRHRAITGDITKAATDKQLWQLAENLTPPDDSGKYAQAMMDIGATICTRTRPKCELCPVAIDCMARQMGAELAFPVKKKPKATPHRHSLVLRLVSANTNKTLWCQRTSSSGDGIWEGLWCLPMLHLAADDSHQLTAAAMTAAVAAILEGASISKNSQTLAELQLLALLIDRLSQLNISPAKHIRHTLTHFHWHLYLYDVTVDGAMMAQIDKALTATHASWQWQSDQGSDKLAAMPTAMLKLLA